MLTTLKRAAKSAVQSTTIMTAVAVGAVTGIATTASAQVTLPATNVDVGEYATAILAKITIDYGTILVGAVSLGVMFFIVGLLLKMYTGRKNTA